MGIYDGLEHLLSRERAAVVELSFDEIERAIGRPLPKSANTESFWENPSNRAQFSGIKRAIRNAGFTGSLVDGTARVRFSKF